METFYVFFVSKVFLVYICTMNDELSNILKRVSSLYQKYGIKSVTMDDVSHELGISKKTLYQYVRDKDELVRKVVELEITVHHEYMNSSSDVNLNAIEELAGIARCVGFMLKEYSAATEYDLRKYYPDLYVMVRERRRELMYKFTHNNLVKGKAEGLYRENLNVDIITKLSVSHLDSMFENEIITISEFLDPRFFVEYFVYHLRGIVNEKGLSILDSTLRTYEIGVQKNEIL